MKPTNNKISKIQCLLTVLFVSSLLISTVTTGKQVQLPFGVVMPGAVIIFPITYILSDLFSEVYGYRWSRTTCYLGFLMNLLMVGVFSLVIITPAPSFWNNQEAFEIVLGNTPRVFVASVLGFVLGDLVNDKVFYYFKLKHPNDTKGFGLRAIVSSVLGELTDSMIFLPLAFIGQMPVNTLLKMMVVQTSVKTLYELLIMPITTVLAKKLYKLENKEDI